MIKKIETEEEYYDRHIEHATIMPMFGDNMLDLNFEPEKCSTDRLPLVALRNMVMFPGLTMPLSVGRTKSIRVVKEAEKNKRYIGVICQTNTVDEPGRDDLYSYGVVCEVVKELELPDGSHSVIIQGRRAFHLEELLTTEPYLMGEVTLLEEEMLPLRARRTKALLSIIRDDINAINECADNPITGEILFALNNVTDPNFLINYLSSTFPMSVKSHQQLLEIRNLEQRGTQLATIISKCLAYNKVKNQMHQLTQVELTSLQRQQYLRTQIHSIQEELGESSQEDVENLLKQGLSKKWSSTVQKQFRKEVTKLQRMNEQSPDYYVQYNYLQTMVDLPWGVTTQDNLNLKNAQRVLDRDHYGLKSVKERILEHLAVLKVRGDMKSPILCFVGPPGVGKTSLGKSIASALKREYVRISLGGLHDEAEIRGHRRTYIGALPGRIISGIQKAKSDNPVFVLDEIDKIASDFKGDPSSALLEVLDPEQNKAFHDNYLDVDYDLSNVLFIATANSLAPIAAPLRDRMEVIELSGYILEEKIEIGERHLLPKQKEEHGLGDIKFTIPRRTMERIIDQYTRESGVRLLDKALAKVMR
ncbi:MAG: LON peptidase substrate-binding domain-containing protein, partial [Bacteroidales bacterium]|nr:LON peptidase substrate-binding domain-containing protein [Bacteroidales bacterium]